VSDLKPRASIIEQIEANGLGDWMDHEDWESTDWAKGMGADMRVTAKLAAHGIEIDRVERMMDLPEGQIDLWWKENEKFQRAAQSSFWEQRERAPQLDPTKVLTSRQLRAAEAYFVDATSQKVAAEAAGVSDRTVRTWLKDPVFIYYGEQLRGERAAAISREREAMETRTLIRYLDQVEKAIDVLDERLKKRDSKVALAVARPYMRSPR
jgi:hypothetical protein